jgi:hypothetical protein
MPAWGPAPAVAEAALEQEPAAEALELRPGQPAAVGAAEQFIARMAQTELTTCRPGMVWDSKNQRCLARHSAVLPQRELTEFEFAHAKEPSARR